MLNKYYFLDTIMDPEDKGFEVIILAESLIMAWTELDNDRERYLYVAGPNFEEDEYELVD